MDYYVYIHCKPISCEVFYVGKGCKRRAWANERNIHWSNTIAKYGIEIKIVCAGLQQWYALELEKDLITYYGRKDLGYGPLVNMTDGGDGLSSSDAKLQCAKNKELGIGLFSLTKEQLSDNGKINGTKGGKARALVGDLPAMARENAHKGGKEAHRLGLGIHKEGVAKRAAEKTVTLNIGIHARSATKIKEDSIKGGIASCSTIYRCLECGYTSIAMVMGTHHKKHNHSGKVRVITWI